MLRINRWIVNTVNFMNKFILNRYLILVHLIFAAASGIFAQPISGPKALEQGANANALTADMISVCPVSDKTPDKLSMDLKADDDAPLVDANREIKDFSTNFVVAEFFKTERSLFNFLSMVYVTIDHELALYRRKHGLDERAVFFIFKGGNVLRLIANQVMSKMPPEAAQKLKDVYGGYFKRSDADFGVFIDPSRLRGLDYEKTLTELTNLVYETLNVIRYEFTKNRTRYFDFMAMNTEEAKAVVREYFDKLNGLESLADKDNPNWYSAKFAQMQIGRRWANNDLKCPYEGQYDYLYEIDKADPTKIAGIPLTKQPSWIMNTINRTLEWPVPAQEGKIVKFDLVRAKIQFEYTYLKDLEPYRKPIGGELIDVSFPHRKDFRLEHFLKHYDDWIATYRITLGETGQTLTLKAESVPGLAADLREVVFEQNNRPWDDAKYQKRINRLFFLSLVDMVSNQTLTKEQAIDYLALVQSKIVDPLKRLYPLQGEQSHTLLNEIRANIGDVAKQFPTIKVANELWTSLGHLIKENMIDVPQDTDTEQFADMMKMIQENMDVIKDLANMDLPKLNMKDIYTTTMKSLL